MTTTTMAMAEQQDVMWAQLNGEVVSREQLKKKWDDAWEAWCHGTEIQFVVTVCGHSKHDTRAIFWCARSDVWHYSTIFAYCIRCGSGMENSGTRCVCAMIGIVIFLCRAFSRQKQQIPLRDYTVVIIALTHTHTHSHPHSFVARKSARRL